MKKQKTYTEAELVKFGNYLLSDHRKERISNEMKQSVTDADICNFPHIKL